MNMLHKPYVILLGSAFLALVIITPANAFSVTVGGKSVPGQGVFSSVPGATTIDFESGAPTSGPVVYSSPVVVSGSQPGLYAAPANDTTNYLTVGSFTNSVTITFDRLADYFGFYVGSPDPCNGIAFYNGSNLITSQWGFNGFSASSFYLNFFADPGEYFNRVEIFSPLPAVETDNHAYKSAAEPSTSFATILGLGTIIAARKRRRIMRG